MTEKTPTPAFVPETERQAAELAAMRRMLQASQGTFSLSFAVCNSPALRDYLIERLRSDYDGIEVVQLPEPTEDVYDTVRNTARDPERSSLFLVNLEKSLPSSASEHPVLRTLNATRELWKQDYPCPVVLWLPEYAATLLSQHSRDLWAWRSHQFEFVSELAEPAAAMADRFAGDLAAASNLDADQKRFRIAELEQRIKDVGDPPPEELAPHVCVWLTELGFLRHVIGELDCAETMLQKALAIDKRLERRQETAKDYGNLALIYQTRGDLDRAEHMHRKALDIDEELGQLEGMAAGYGNLGLIYRKRGDLDKAEKLHRKALEIEQKLGRLEGMAADYGNLGLIYETRGDLDKAEKLHRKALEIEEKLGSLEGMASSYGNIGTIFGRRGDLDKAEEMHRKSLEMNEKLGRLEGMAADYGNLGLIYQTRGDLDKAEKLHRKSLEIEKKLGRLEGMAREYANLGLIYRKRGDVDEAEEMHRKSLEINEKLGGLEGMASDYGNLGLVYRTRGDVVTARSLWTKARDLFEQIGIPHKVEKTQRLLDELPPDTPDSI